MDIFETCWIWTKTLHNGYGLTTFNGKVWTVHRLVYILFYGEVPKGYDVHHKCKNKACYNPTHMKVLSRSEHIKHHRRVEKREKRGIYKKWTRETNKGQDL